jgi:hypothetical protein
MACTTSGSATESAFAKLVVTTHSATYSTACQGVPACRIAISNPCDDLSQLISKIQSSIVSWEQEHQSHTNKLLDRWNARRSSQYHDTVVGNTTK